MSDLIISIHTPTPAQRVTPKRTLPTMPTLQPYSQRLREAYADLLLCRTAYERAKRNSALKTDCRTRREARALLPKLEKRAKDLSVEIIRMNHAITAL